MLQQLHKWSPDYDKVARNRITLLEIFEDKTLQEKALQAYAKNPVEWIEDWVDTFDPRLAMTGRPVKMPFILFDRQRELIEFFHACLLDETNGLVEKTRDVGATWCGAAFSVWLLLFHAGASVGWGSRKQDLVDRIGDLDSIFEKMRKLIEGLPPFLRPNIDTAFMKIINLTNGASITGESGDNIGRGGRKLIYFKDESAHYEHPESIEAALSENTRVQIDISSVSGVGNVFHRKREGGVDWEPGTKLERNKTYVFVFDWRDHPQRSQKWFDERKQYFIDQGLLNVFAQEVERDYAASQAGAILQRDWIYSAIDAHKKISGMVAGRYVAGLDVADGGGDTNALVRRKGSILEYVEEWGERDTGTTARRCVDAVKKFLPCDVMYDCVGIGSGVKAEVNRLKDDKLLPAQVRMVAWDAGASAEPPDDHVIKNDLSSPLNKDHYYNLKAQGWMLLRKRFECTHRMITEGVKYRPEDLISINSETIPPALLRKLEKELLQPTASLSPNMRVLVDKVPEGSRSPNIGDAIMMCYHPLTGGFDATLSWV